MTKCVFLRFFCRGVGLLIGSNTRCPRVLDRHRASADEEGRIRSAGREREPKGSMLTQRVWHVPALRRSRSRLKFSVDRKPWSTWRLDRYCFGDEAADWQAKAEMVEFTVFLISRVAGLYNIGFVYRSFSKSSSAFLISALYILSRHSPSLHTSTSPLLLPSVTLPILTMVDTQRFAIWHPPGMPAETKKTAPVPIIPEHPQPLNRNIENLVKDFKWNDNFSPAKSGSLPTSRSRIQSVSSYTRPSAAPQPIHLATQLSKADEDDSESTSSEEEGVKVPPVTTRKFSSSSPPKPILSSTPVNSNLTNTRPKQTERVSFVLPKVGLSLLRNPPISLKSSIQETPKENESNLSQPRTKPIEKPTSQGPKVVPRFRSIVQT